MIDRLQDLLNEAEVQFLMGRISADEYQTIVDNIITIYNTCEE